jgi:type VI protein secretion system component VasK
MKLLLSNGTVINNTPDMSDKTRKYLNQFWSFPSKKEVEKEKEKYYVTDYKREWQRKIEVTECDITI